ncbi:MAG TPA: oligosaccharide flippase family protein [Bacteroidia bacterium]|nr:oligosaccharide flippase family protein [Bacteroidia bacterium]
MAEQRTISKNIFHTFLVQIPNYILTLVAGILVTRLLGPESKGVFTLLTANIQLLVMFLGLNVPGAIQFFVANKKIEPSRLASVGLVLMLISSFIVFLSLFFWPFATDALLAPGHEHLFFKVYFFLSFFMANFNAMVIGFIQGKFRFKELNLLTLINSILNFIIFSSMYFASRYGLIEAGLNEVLILSLSIIFINVFIAYAFFRRELNTTLFTRFSRAEINQIVAFLVPSYISILVNFFNYRLTIWQVNYYEGTENLGYFSLALNFAQLMLIVTAAINTVLFPFFASKEGHHETINDFGFILKINGIIMFIATCGLVLFSGFIIPLLYGDAFIPSITAVKILAVGTFFCSQSQVFGHYFGARNKNWINTIIYLVALSCVGILGPILMMNYGIEGAAVASSCSYVLMFILFSVFLRIKFNVNPLSLFKITRQDWDRAKGILNRITKKGEQV